MCVCFSTCVYMCICVCIRVYICVTRAADQGEIVTRAADQWGEVWHMRQLGGAEVWHVRQCEYVYKCVYQQCIVNHIWARAWIQYADVPIVRIVSPSVRSLLQYVWLCVYMRVYVCKCVYMRIHACICVYMRVLNCNVVLALIYGELAWFQHEE